MMTKNDMERVGVIAARAERGQATPEEKGELRNLVSKHNPVAMDLAWDVLLDATFLLLGIYSLAKIAAEPTGQAAAP